MEWILAVAAVICIYGYWRRGQQFDVMKAHALQLEDELAKLQENIRLKNDRIRDLEGKGDNDLDLWTSM